MTSSESKEIINQRDKKETKAPQRFYLTMDHHDSLHRAGVYGRMTKDKPLLSEKNRKDAYSSKDMWAG